ncbi:MAG: hypothetical protein AAGU05_07950, partial [Anaerolineaceae bacterium]
MYNFVISPTSFPKTGMEGFFSLKTFLRLLAAAVVLAAVIILIDRKMGSTLLGKQAAAGEMVRVVEHTVEVTRLVERVITATPGPAQTQPVSNAANLPPSTATPSPSPTPQGLYVPDDGVTVWCLPKTSYANTALFQIGETPAEAVQSARENGRLTIITQTKSCTFMVSFSDDMPEGTLLKIQDLGPEPFINTPLVPLLNNP